MSSSSGSEMATPFHAGELDIQERLGVRERVHSYAPRFIRDHMTDRDRKFFGQLPHLVVGSVDRAGRPWASMMVGRPGFISTPDINILSVTARPLFGDPLIENIMDKAPMGFLGIEFHSRRRVRLNGKISSIGADGFQIAIDQAFGNCPQYIQKRDFNFSDDTDHAQTPPSVIRSWKLGQAARSFIEGADTFFITSVFSEDTSIRSHGVDVSHRGGAAGFVRVVDEQTLSFPDYSGNNHFNTLGNILLNPVAGLLFPDFETGDMLYITGGAGIIWDGDDRHVRITIENVIRVERSLPLTLKVTDQISSYK
ncbi:probable iron-sulfur binding protein YPO1417 [hydrothermal vent metagenome]|uniref:Probable iron-sulfur binding protein YPO1417 n=1 Tax=hydrothermal vent metagenome TaxID=652676 RepID=A0A3B0RMW9_9ZZZZ